MQVIEKEWTGKHMRYLTCSCCAAKACAICLEKILLKASSAVKNEDPWFVQVSHFLCGGPYGQAEFIGSCCELKLARERAAAVETSFDHAVTVRQLLCLKHPPKLVDGLLYLPELHLFLGSPFHEVDIHGFGEMKGAYGGLAHCVVGIASVAAAGAEGVYPSPWKCKIE